MFQTTNQIFYISWITDVHLSTSGVPYWLGCLFAGFGSGSSGPLGSLAAFGWEETRSSGNLTLKMASCNEFSYEKW